MDIIRPASSAWLLLHGAARTTHEKKQHGSPQSQQWGTTAAPFSGDFETVVHDKARRVGCTIHPSRALRRHAAACREKDEMDATKFVQLETETETETKVGTETEAETEAEAEAEAEAQKEDVGFHGLHLWSTLLLRCGDKGHPLVSSLWS